MKKKEILQKIIAEEGDCGWVVGPYRCLNVCQFCPLGRLRVKKNGDYYSCLDAVLGEKESNDLSHKEINALYKQEAENVLAQIIIDEEMGVDEGDYLFNVDSNFRGDY